MPQKMKLKDIQDFYKISQNGKLLVYLDLMEKFIILFI
jgi:hypothetical protein